MADGTHAELLATTPLYSEVLAQAASEEQAAPRPPRRATEDLGLEDDVLEPEGVRSDVRRPAGGPPDGRRRVPRARRRPACPSAASPTSCRTVSTCSWRRSPSAASPTSSSPSCRREHEKKRLTLTTLLMEYPGMLVLAALLVGLIALFTQLGPSLVSYAINHGLTPPHYDFGVVVVMAVLYLVVDRRLGHAPSGGRPG